MGFCERPISLRNISRHCEVSLMHSIVQTNFFISCITLNSLTYVFVCLLKLFTFFPSNLECQSEDCFNLYHVVNNHFYEWEVIWPQGIESCGYLYLDLKKLRSRKWYQTFSPQRQRDKITIKQLLHVLQHHMHLDDQTAEIINKQKNIC